MRHSILKKTSLYDVLDAKTSAEHALNNISFINASTTSASKIVRFSGVDTQETNTNNNSHSNEEVLTTQQPTTTNGSDNKLTTKEAISSNQSTNTNTNRTHHSKDNQSNNNADDSFEEATNELKKYYRKSKALPFKQINLVGLNGEFLVSSSSSNTNQIMGTSPQTILQSNGSYIRHQKTSLQRSKSLRVASAHKHQSEFRSNRQNTYPSISKTTPIATPIKPPTPLGNFTGNTQNNNTANNNLNIKTLSTTTTATSSNSNLFDTPTNQSYYYWPSVHHQSSNYFMSTLSNNLPRSPLSYQAKPATPTNLNRSFNSNSISASTSHLNSSILSQKPSNSSGMPLINNRTLFTSSNGLGPVINDLSAVVSTPKIDTNSYSTLENYSSQLINSNLVPSRSNSSHSLTLYTYLVQSSNKSVRKEAKANLLRAKKQSDSELLEMKQIHTNQLSFNGRLSQLPKAQKFSSIAGNFLNSSTNSISRGLNTRRLGSSLLETSATEITDARLNNNINGNRKANSSFFFNNQMPGALRFRTNSANTVSSTAIN